MYLLKEYKEELIYLLKKHKKLNDLLKKVNRKNHAIILFIV